MIYLIIDIDIQLVSNINQNIMNNTTFSVDLSDDILSIECKDCMKGTTKCKKCNLTVKCCFNYYGVHLMYEHDDCDAYKSSIKAVEHLENNSEGKRCEFCNILLLQNKWCTNGHDGTRCKTCDEPNIGNNGRQLGKGKCPKGHDDTFCKICGKTEVDFLGTKRCNTCWIASLPKCIKCSNPYIITLNRQLCYKCEKN